MAKGEEETFHLILTYPFIQVLMMSVKHHEEQVVLYAEFQDEKRKRELQQKLSTAKATTKRNSRARTPSRSRKR